MNTYQQKIASVIVVIAFAVVTILPSTIFAATVSGPYLPLRSTVQSSTFSNFQIKTSSSASNSINVIALPPTSNANTSDSSVILFNGVTLLNEHIGNTVIHLMDEMNWGTISTTTSTTTPPDSSDTVTSSDQIEFNLPPPTPPNFTIDASSGPFGYVSPSGPVSVPEGGDQSFTMIPFAGYKLDDVLIDGKSIGPIGFSNFAMVSGDHTIRALFSLIPPAPTSTITASAYANGFIYPSGPVSVPAGSDQSFVITPSAGYQIQDVIIDGVSTGPVPYSTFTMVTGNHTIDATFSPIVTTPAAVVTNSDDNKPTIPAAQTRNSKATILKKVETSVPKTSTIRSEKKVNVDKTSVQ